MESILDGSLLEGDCEAVLEGDCCDGIKDGPLEGIFDVTSNEEPQN
jgi:hypothetical protein